MRLWINNFAKIQQADIVMDGITVIAGENNTGKSTVGKILFSLFNSMSDIEDKIAEQRMEEIEDVSRSMIRTFLRNSLSANKAGGRGDLSFTIRRITGRIADEIKKNSAKNTFQVSGIVKGALSTIPGIKKEEEEFQYIVSELTEQTVSIMALSDDAITLEVLSRYFNKVFHDQINSLLDKNTDAELDLNIKGKSIRLLFSDNKCRAYVPGVSIAHQAIYIDNPFILDQMSGFTDMNAMDEHLVNLLTRLPKDDIMEGIIGSVLAKEKLDEVYKALQFVVGGQIVEKGADDFYLEEKELTQPIHFNNLSTGLKSFVILKMLLERGVLREKDVLILDEPEIHLHPQWQVAYAELIVLLQKKFDLTIVVTTHSPYFLDAINLFSVKYGIEKKSNYYLALAEEKGIRMELVTDNIEMIYKKMASPIQMLDSLRYELNNR